MLVHVSVCFAGRDASCGEDHVGFYREREFGRRVTFLVSHRFAYLRVDLHR